MSSDAVNRTVKKFFLLLKNSQPQTALFNIRINPSITPLTTKPITGVSYSCVGWVRLQSKVLA